MQRGTGYEEGERAVSVDWPQLSADAKESRDRRPYRVIGAKLRSVRHAAKLTQEQASLGSGISRSYIARCESGLYCLTVPMLQMLARAYGVTLSSLLEGL